MEEELYFHPVTGKLDIRPSTEPCTYNRPSSCDVVRNKRMGSKAFTSCLLIPETCDRMLVSNPNPAQAARKGSVCSTKKYLYRIFFPSVHLATALFHRYFFCFSNSPRFETRHRFIEGRIKTFNQFNRALTAAHFFKVTRPGPYAEGVGGGGMEGLLKFLHICLFRDC